MALGKYGKDTHPKMLRTFQHISVLSMCSSGTGNSFEGNGRFGKGGKGRCFALLTLPSKMVVGSKSKSSIGYFGFGSERRARAAAASAMDVSPSAALGPFVPEGPASGEAA